MRHHPTPNRPIQHPENRHIALVSDLKALGVSLGLGTYLLYPDFSLWAFFEDGIKRRASTWGTGHSAIMRYATFFIGFKRYLLY